MKNLKIKIINGKKKDSRKIDTKTNRFMKNKDVIDVKFDNGNIMIIYNRIKKKEMRA